MVVDAVGQPKMQHIRFGMTAQVRDDPVRHGRPRFRIAVAKLRIARLVVEKAPPTVLQGKQRPMPRLNIFVPRARIAVSDVSQRFRRPAVPHRLKNQPAAFDRFDGIGVMSP